MSLLWKNEFYLLNKQTNINNVFIYLKVESMHITKGKLSSKVYLGLGKDTLEMSWTVQLQLQLAKLI